MFRICPSPLTLTIWRTWLRCMARDGRAGVWYVSVADTHCCAIIRATIARLPVTVVINDHSDITSLEFVPC